MALIIEVLAIVFLEVVVVILVVISELVTQGGIKEGVVCRLGAQGLLVYF